jgi:hypothetical protein
MAFIETAHARARARARRQGKVFEVFKHPDRNFESRASIFECALRIVGNNIGEYHVNSTCIHLLYVMRAPRRKLYKLHINVNAETNQNARRAYEYIISRAPKLTV